MWHARTLDQVLAKRHVSLAVICCSLLLATMLATVSLKGTESFGSRGNSRHGDRVLDKRKSFCPGPEIEPSERREPWNQKFARQLSAEVASLDAHKVQTHSATASAAHELLANPPTYSTIQGCELVFYGDSITEAWRASDGGRPCPRCEGVPEVFKQYFGSFTSSVLAVGGEVHLCCPLHCVPGDTHFAVPRLFQRDLRSGIAQPSRLCSCDYSFQCRFCSQVLKALLLVCKCSSRSKQCGLGSAANRFWFAMMPLAHCFEIEHHTGAMLCLQSMLMVCLFVSGDQAMHLLWRLRHGQVFERHQPKIAFVMIGTNDLGAASCLGGESAILQAAAGTVER